MVLPFGAPTDPGGNRPGPPRLSLGLQEPQADWSHRRSAADRRDGPNQCLYRDDSRFARFGCTDVSAVYRSEPERVDRLLRGLLDWRVALVSSLLEYASELAPPGRIAKYMGLAQLPWLLAKGTTGVYSGFMLNRYCPPATPPEQLHTGMLWFIYGCIAMSTPIGLWLRLTVGAVYRADRRSKQMESGNGAGIEVDHLRPSE